MSYIYIYIYIQIYVLYVFVYKHTHTHIYIYMAIVFTGIFVYIQLTISSCYGSLPLTLVLIGSDGGLSTLCHSCGFACQQRVLKTFFGPSYLPSEDGVV